MRPPSRLFACDRTSRGFSRFILIPNVTQSVATPFFRLPFGEVSTFRPRQMPNDSYESLFFFCNLLPSRWSRCTSGRHPFRLYNFLFEEIDFQLVVQFHSKAHDSPIRNFGLRKFVLVFNKYLRLATTIDSRLRLSTKGINSSIKHCKFNALLMRYIVMHLIRHEVEKSHY